MCGICYLSKPKTVRVECDASGKNILSFVELKIRAAVSSFCTGLSSPNFECNLSLSLFLPNIIGNKRACFNRSICDLSSLCVSFAAHNASNCRRNRSSLYALGLCGKENVGSECGSSYKRSNRLSMPVHRA